MTQPYDVNWNAASRLFMQEIFGNREDKQDEEFTIERLNDHYDNVHEQIDDFDPNQFTEEQLQESGFRQYNEGFYLIPIHLFDSVREGTEVETITGEEKVVGEDDINTDVRRGMLGVGVRV